MKKNIMVSLVLLLTVFVFADNTELKSFFQAQTKRYEESNTELGKVGDGDAYAKWLLKYGNDIQETQTKMAAFQKKHPFLAKGGTLPIDLQKDHDAFTQAMMKSMMAMSAQEEKYKDHPAVKEAQKKVMGMGFGELKKDKFEALRSFYKSALFSADYMVQQLKKSGTVRDASIQIWMLAKDIKKQREETAKLMTQNPEYKEVDKIPADIRTDIQKHRSLMADAEKEARKLLSRYPNDRDMKRSARILEIAKNPAAGGDVKAKLAEAEKLHNDMVSVNEALCKAVSGKDGKAVARTLNAYIDATKAYDKKWKAFIAANPELEYKKSIAAIQKRYFDAVKKSGECMQKTSNFMDQ